MSVVKPSLHIVSNLNEFPTEKALRNLLELKWGKIKKMRYIMNKYTTPLKPVCVFVDFYKWHNTDYQSKLLDGKQLNLMLSLNNDKIHYLQIEAVHGGIKT